MLAACSFVCTFLGYMQNCKAYHLFHHLTHHIIESCDIIFNEGGTSKCIEHIIIEDNATLPDANDVPDAEAIKDKEKVPTPKSEGKSKPKSKIEDMLKPEPELEPEPEPESIAKSRPRHMICVLIRDDDLCYTIT